MKDKRKLSQTPKNKIQFLQRIIIQRHFKKEVTHT